MIAMDFIDLLQKRQSDRDYHPQPVEQWKIDKLIEAVRLSPSASNSQPWKLIIVDDPELKEKVARATHTKLIPLNKFVPKAPVIAVLTIERPKIITQVGAHLKDREFPLIDIGIASAHFCLQAEELGLGTCMLGWFDEEKIKQYLNIPAKTRIGLLITVGYSSDKKRKKIRKTREKMSSFNRY